MSDVDSAPFVSVIIPTYNRAASLARAVRSFSALDYPQDRYEIVVADNHSTDGTRGVVEALQGASRVRLSYLFEPRQGVHFARNSAASQARGDILYFTDDDMVADPGLLRTLLPVFQRGQNVASAGGRVLPQWEQPPPPWILEYCNNHLLSLIDRPEELLVCGADPGIFSCHQAIPRRAFFEAGGFNPENTAGEWLGDGETGLNLKLQALGYRFAYVRRSVVYHVIPAGRMTQRYLNHRLENQASAECYTNYRRGPRSSLRLVAASMVSSAGAVKRLMATPLHFVGSSRWRLDWAYVHYFLSRIRYDLRLLRDERWRDFVLRNDWLAQPPDRPEGAAAEAAGSPGPR